MQDSAGILCFRHDSYSHYIGRPLTVAAMKAKVGCACMCAFVEIVSLFVVVLCGVVGVVWCGVVWCGVV